MNYKQDMNSLLEQIKNYSIRTHDLRESRKVSIDSIEFIYQNRINKISNDIVYFQKEKNNNLQQISILKNQLRDTIFSIYKIKSFTFLGDILNGFDLKKDLIKDHCSESDIEAIVNQIKDLQEKDKAIDSEISNLISIHKKELDKKYSDDKNQINSEFEKNIIKINKPLKTLYLESLKHLSENYTNTAKPQKSLNIPKFLTIGNYIINSNNELKEITTCNPIKIPVDINLFETGNIILSIDPEYFRDKSDYVDDIIVALIMRYIDYFPKNSLKLGLYNAFCNPFGKTGTLFSALSKNNLTITPEICGSKESFLNMFSTILKICKNLNSELLENNCFSLYDLYKKGIKEKYFQLIVLKNVFGEFDVNDITTFCTYLKELHKCGVRFVIIDDFFAKSYTNKPSAFKAQLKNLIDNCDTFTFYQKNIEDKYGNNVELVNCASATTQTIYNFIKEYCNNAKN